MHDSTRHPCGTVKSCAAARAIKEQRMASKAQVDAMLSSEGMLS